MIFGLLAPKDYFTGLRVSTAINATPLVFILVPLRKLKGQSLHFSVRRQRNPPSKNVR
jgi:hypothetical protein